MLNELSKEIHNNAKEKGFYEKERNISELLMLIVSELGEAQEALRKGKRVRYWQIDYYKDCVDNPNLDADMVFESSIKDTFEDEIADSIIRLLDLCGYMNIDIDFHLKEKMKYNKNREYKHGKKF